MLETTQGDQKHYNIYRIQHHRYAIIVSNSEAPPTGILSNPEVGCNLRLRPAEVRSARIVSVHEGVKTEASARGHVGLAHFCQALAMLYTHTRTHTYISKLLTTRVVAGSIIT